jgi:DNA-directed RNA polymerase subunit N (RpoN/RPB10)
MAEPVRCDICGRLYSSRHLSSHKRLSHGGKSSGQIPITDQDVMRQIVDLFSALSEENKKNVLYRLSVPGEHLEREK